MDEYERQEYETAPSEPITERVRIIGAEQAGVVTEQDNGTAPDDPAARYLGFSSAPSAQDEAAAAVEELDPLPAPELPHWSDPPTGQVPAILDRRSEPETPDDEGRAWAALVDSGPVWREHQHEWEDTGFQPALLADDETRVGALEETPLEERQPWEFDDLDLTRPTEIVRREDEPPTTEPSDTGWAPPAPRSEDPVWTSTLDPAPTWGEIMDEAAAETTAEPAAMAQESMAAADEVTAGADDPFPPPPEPRPRLRPAAMVAPTPAAPAEADAPPRYLGRRRPPRPERPTQGDGRKLPAAIVTGVVAAAVALGAFKAGPLATVILATIVVTLAAAEGYAAFRKVGMRPAALPGLAASVAVMVTAYSKGISAIPYVLVLLLVVSMLWYLFGVERGAPVEGIAVTILGFAWVPVFGAFAALLVAPSIYPNRHGLAFLFGAVVATVAADVGALAFGAWLGRHQLAPHVSPNKTWEGFIGGAVLAVVASVAITGQMHPWTPSKAAILGVVVAVVGPVGDLCESLVKRDLGLKDMGSILPGHGGILDRVDALLFVLPATYYLVRLLNLG